MQVLISGGTGFIGTNLTQKLLDSGHEPIIIKRECSKNKFLADKRINWIDYDGSLDSLMKGSKKFSPEVVIHLAGYYTSQHRPEEIEKLVNANIGLGAQLVELMKEKGIQFFINTGTFFQSIDRSSYNPLNLYAATKQGFADILKYYTETKTLKSITLQLYDTYGPGDPRGKFIYQVIRAGQEKKALKMSPGDQEKSFVFIDDVVDAFLQAIDLLKGGKVDKEAIYGVYTSEILTLNELVVMVGKIMGTDIQTNRGFYPYREREIMKIDRSFPVLPGWAPKISLEQGIKEILKGGEN